MLDRSAGRALSRGVARELLSSTTPKRRCQLVASHHASTSYASMYAPQERQRQHKQHTLLQHGRSVRRLATDANGTRTIADRPESSDAVIVGGGVVGLALACALANSAAFRASGASITLIEASPLQRLRNWSKDKQSSGVVDDWENRAIYLTEENKAWLSSLQLDEYLLTNRFGDVHSMHVTDGLTGAALDFDAPKSGATVTLGTMVEISNLQQAMLRRLEAIASKANVPVRILDGCKVERIEALEPTGSASAASYSDAWPLLHLSDGRKPIKARLLIGADGNNSPVRKYAGISAHGWPYGKMGVVGTIKISEKVEGERIAFQRFLPTGTIAWLPLSDDAASLVWTLPPDIAKAVVGLQKHHEQRGDGSTSPIALLITAGFRLPWTTLGPILTRLATDFSMDIQDDSWIIPTLQQHMLDTSFSEQSTVSDVVPAQAMQLLEKSVAAFPLKLSHAQSYLGSSSRQTTIAEAGAGAILPSTLVHNVIRGVSALTSSTAGTSDDVKGPAHGRTALIGDAAHTIHPLAGQGLNLGLADARSLADALLRACNEGADLGSHLSLQAYPRERYLANQAMLSAVDHLHWLFVSPSPPNHPASSIVGDLVSRAVVWGRSSGFEVLNELDTVKRAIIGAAGSARTRRN